MRVIGVTTSLAPEAMQGAAPDEIQPGIGSITVADIQGLRLRPDLAPQQAQQAAPAQAAPREQQGATAPAASSTSGQGGSSQGGQAWLNGWVDLPGGYKTTRRDLLKFGSLGGAFGSLYIGATRLQVRRLPAWMRGRLGRVGWDVPRCPALPAPAACRGLLRAAAQTSRRPADGAPLLPCVARPGAA